MKRSRNAGALSNFSLFASMHFELPWLRYLSWAPKIWSPYNNRGIKKKRRASKTEKAAQPQICICKWAPTATTVLKAISPLILYKDSVFPQPTENKTKKNDSVQKQIHVLIQQLLYAESNRWEPGGHKYAPESTVLSGK